MKRERGNRARESSLRRACQARGLKATPQRLEILKHISVATNHPSVEAIYKLVKAKIPGISFDTVYRTLSSFEAHKLVTRVHHLDDKTRYDPNTQEHHHFICISCKKIIDFDWPGFASLKLPPESSKFGIINQKYAELRGLCQKCSRKS